MIFITTLLRCCDDALVSQLIANQVRMEGEERRGGRGRQRVGEGGEEGRQRVGEGGRGRQKYFPCSNHMREERVMAYFIMQLTLLYPRTGLGVKCFQESPT